MKYEFPKDAPKKLRDAFHRANERAFEAADAEGAWSWRPTAWEAFQLGWLAAERASKDGRK